MARRLTLSERNREELRRQLDRREGDPVWGIILSEPAERLFVRNLELEQTSIYSTIIGDHLDFRTRPTDVEGVTCVELECPVEVLATFESFMRGTMAVLRQSGLHGRYHRGAEDRYYEF